MKIAYFLLLRRYFFVPLLFPIILISSISLFLNDPISRQKQQRLTTYDFVSGNISSKLNVKMTYQDEQGNKTTYISETGKEIINNISSFEFNYSQHYYSDNGELIIGNDEYSIGFYRNHQYARFSRLAEFGFMKIDTFTAFYKISLENHQEIFDLTSNFWTSINENGKITHD